MLEARVRGPNITPGYWRDHELTRAAFDDEGFYRLGDAHALRRSGRPVAGLHVRGPPRRGLQALDRHVGPRRSAAGARCSRTSASSCRTSSSPGTIATSCGVLVFPNLAACRALAGAAPDAPRRRRARRIRAVVERFATALDAFAAAQPAARRASRARCCSTSRRRSTRGEITDKGSINQKAVLRHRARARRRSSTATPGAALAHRRLRQDGMTQ